MFESFLHLFSHNAAALSNAGSHSPQAAIAAVLCALMIKLFN